MFKPVNREKNRLRMALDGPAGAGKTWTALTFAFALGKKVAVIDSEHNSAALYAGVNGWDFDGVGLENFAPSTYTACIEAAGREGYDVLVIDSLSHAWSGKGGALDQVDRAAASGAAGGSYGAWRDVTPQHNEMVEAIRKFPGHVIITLRTKMEYVLEEGAGGKKQVHKVGLRPVQREGVEYEFDIVADLDAEHRLTVSKTRYSGIDGKIVHKPGPEFMDPIVRWLAEGADRKSETAIKVKKEEEPVTTEFVAGEIKEYWRRSKQPVEKLKEFLETRGVKRVGDLPASTAEKLLARAKELAAEQEAKETF